MTPELRALLKRKQAAVTAAQAITALATTEERDLTDEEEEEHSGLVASLQKINGQIERQQVIDSAALSLEPDDDQTPAPGLSGSISGGEPAIVNDPRGGFNSFGEFAACVVRASVPGNSQGMDERLMINAAVPSTYGNESSGADGGYAVPTEYRSEIMVAVNAETTLFNRTDQIPISTNGLKMPVDETTDWQTSGGITTAWEDEVGQLTGSKPNIKLAEWYARKITSLVNVSDDLLEDAVAMDAYIRRRAPAKISFAVDLAIVRGDGVGRPLGYLKSPSLVTVAKEGGQAADTILAANINNMYQRFPASKLNNAVWIANQDIMAQLETLQFVGTESPHPLFVPPGGLSSAPYARLKGLPVIYHQAASTLGDLGDLSLVDLSQYATVVKRGGLKVDTSMHLYFDSNAMAFRFIMRVGGHPWLSAPIQPRVGSNTMSPFVTLAERA